MARPRPGWSSGPADESDEVYLGWSRDMEAGEISRWVDEQDTASMLGYLHKLVVHTGDAVLVPAGHTPCHRRGGVRVGAARAHRLFHNARVRRVRDIDPSRGGAGAGPRSWPCPACVTKRSARATCRSYASKVGRSGSSAPEVGAGPKTSKMSCPLPPTRTSGRSECTAVKASGCDPSFAVIVAVSGQGWLSGDGWEATVARGSTLVVPWSAGTSQVFGQVELLRCLPPLAVDAAMDDPTAGDPAAA